MMIDVVDHPTEKATVQRFGERVSTVLGLHDGAFSGYFLSWTKEALLICISNQ